MKLYSLLSIAASAMSFGIVTAQEAARFGSVSVSPSVVKLGQNFTVHYNSTTATHHPKFYDAYMQATLPSGFISPFVLLSRNEYGEDEVNNYFTTSLPADFPNAANASWLVWAFITYPVDSTPGGVLEYGGTSAAITVEFD